MKHGLMGWQISSDTTTYVHASKAEIRGEPVDTYYYSALSSASVGRHGCTLLRDNDAECLRCCCCCRERKQTMDGHTVGQGRRMRCYKPAPCSLSSCMQIGTYRRRAIVPRRSVGRVGRGCCFIGKAHQVFGFCFGGSVSVVCRCWAAFSMARCAARRPLYSRYQFSSHAIPCSISIITADSRVGTADSVVLLARVDSPCKVCFSHDLAWPASPAREPLPGLAQP